MTLRISFDIGASSPEKPYYHDDWKADAGGEFGRRNKSRR